MNIPDTIFVDVDDTILEWSAEMMERLTGSRDVSHVVVQYDPRFFGDKSELDKAMVMADLDFWRSLKLTRLGHELLAAIAVGEFDQDVVLVTATPPILPGVPERVNRQIQTVASQAKRELGRMFNLPVVVVTSHNTYGKWAQAKAALAGPRKILIDDSKLMVDAFTAAGGQAVLVPKPWNGGLWLNSELDALEMLRFLCYPIEGVDYHAA